MNLILFLILTVIIFLVVGLFYNKAYQFENILKISNTYKKKSHNILPSQFIEIGKFDPLEVKILHRLLTNSETGISINELNSILNVSTKNDTYQRQRRHLVIKELNTKLFVMYNIRECIVRVSTSYDSRMKYYFISSDIETLDQLHSILKYKIISES